MFPCTFVFHRSFFTRPMSSKLWNRFYTAERSRNEVLRLPLSPLCLEWKASKLLCKEWSEFDLGDGWLIISSGQCRLDTMCTVMSAITTCDRIRQLVQWIQRDFRFAEKEDSPDLGQNHRQNRHPELKILMNLDRKKLSEFQECCSLVLPQPQIPHLQESLVVYHWR